MLNWIKRKIAYRKFKKYLDSYTKRGEWPDEYPNIDIPEDEKKRFVEHMMLIAAKPLLMVFKMCGLRNRMVVYLYNEPSNEHFEFSLKKTSFANGNKELADFMIYVREARNKFCKHIIENHSDNIALRVEAEDILIAFDQMADRLAPK